MTALPSRAVGRRRPGLRWLRSAPILVPVVVIAVVVVAAAFGTLLAPQDPSQQDLLNSSLGPTGGHLLGTDQYGRDVLSRLLAGARSALLGPTVVAAGSLAIGSAIGLVAGYRGGLVGKLLMRLVDLIYSLPALLVAIVIAGVTGGGYWLAVGLLIVLFCPVDARVVRGATLEQRDRPYVEAARLLGMPARHIMLREIWPNVRGVELANAFLNFSYALVYLTALSFLGVGVGPAAADWGRMLADGRSQLAANPWASLAPGLAILALAAAVTLIGDRLEEAVEDRGRMR